MAFCPGPDEPGVCIGCTAYSAHPDVDYIGMSYVPTDYGCDVGCKPCKQMGLPTDWMRPGGPRWMKAYMPLDPSHDDLVYPNRMADGMVGDLRSIGELDADYSEMTTLLNTRRVPEQIYYNRGVCWDNTDNKEGFGKGDLGADACHCDEHQSSAIGDDGTCDGTPQGNPLTGLFPDYFFYNNIQVVTKSGIFCRQRDQHDSLPVWTSTSELYEPSIFRTNQCGGNLFNFCTMNKDCGLPCYEFGKPIPYDCEGGFLNPGHQAFDFVPVEFNNVRLLSGEDNYSFPFGDGPLKDFKNAVLAHLPNIPGKSSEDTFAFGQLDHAPGGGPTWGRGFAPSEPTVDGVQKGRIPFEFGDCRLRSATYPDIDPDKSKRHYVPVTIYPYIVDAQITMWLIAQQVLAKPEGVPFPSGTDYEEAKRIYPHVRMRIKARVSYYATYPGSDNPDVNYDSWPEIFESWWPKDHPYYNRKTSVFLKSGFSEQFAKVDKPLRYPPLVTSRWDWSGVPYEEALAASSDKILIFDSQGQQFDIPDIVEWWGYLGVYSGQKNAYRFRWETPDDAAFNSMSECCKLLGYLDGLEVKGWPYNFGAHREAVEKGINIPEEWTGRGLYGGTVQLNFAQHQNYSSICGPTLPL